MSQDDLSIDFELPTDEEIRQQDTVPAGRYRVVFTEFKKDKTESGNQVVKVTAKVLDGPMQNRMIFYSLFTSGGMDGGTRGRGLIRQMIESCHSTPQAGMSALMNVPVGIDHSLNKKGYANLKKVMLISEVPSPVGGQPAAQGGEPGSGLAF